MKTNAFKARVETVLIILWFVLTGLFRTTDALAQTPTLCASPDQSPEQMAQVQKRVDEWAKAGGQRITGITTIPVSVHVVHQSTGLGDVTDQQVYDQINALNDGFSSTDFQFSLCSIDRTSNDNWADHQYNTQEEIAMKQALAIDPNYVLNFYICASLGGSGVFGYARFPWEVLLRTCMESC